MRVDADVFVREWPSDLERSYALILDSIQTPVIVANAQATILLLNSASELFFGYPRFEARNEPVEALLPDWFHLIEPGPNSVVSTAKKADGTVATVEILARPVLTPVGLLIVATLHDVTGWQNQAVNLKERLESLGSETNDLRSEVKEAAALLESFLPEKIVSQQVDSSWIFLPCHTLGGDMVKVLEVAKDKFCFLILDVSGHGIPAALLSISLTRSLSLKREGILLDHWGHLRTPSEVMTRLNELFGVLTQSNLFVTALYGEFGLKDGAFRYVSAGHPHPILLNGNQAEVVDGEINLPIGVMEDCSFQESSVFLEPGDLILLYTDGVSETRDSRGNLFGEEGLLRLLTDHRASAPCSILQKLTADLEHFRECKAQRDDVTVLAARYLER